jgi:uncharacterized membrane protein
MNYQGLFKNLTLSLPLIITLPLGLNVTASNALSPYNPALSAPSQYPAANVVQEPSTYLLGEQEYVLSSASKAGGYPTLISPGETGKVLLVIANFEKEPASYKIVMNEFGREKTLADQVMLKDGATWQAAVEIAPLATDTEHQVKFILFKNGSDSVYRTLQLSVDIK